VVDRGGVVDDDVDAAELCEGIAGRSGDLSGAGDVAGENQCVAPVGFDLDGEVSEGVGATGEDRYVGVGVGQRDFRPKRRDASVTKVFCVPG
jgi:hypothetical protein